MKFLTQTKKGIIKNTIATLIICILVLAPVSTSHEARFETNEAEAFLGGGDPATIALWLKEQLLDMIVWMIINQVLEGMIEAMTDWVRSGFRGNPAFITDLDGFLLEIADQAAGEFISGGPLDFLCDSFSLQIQGALSLQYGSTGHYYQPTCTLSDVVDNMEGFLEGDFLEGGWDGFASMAFNENNNVWGQTFEAQAEMGIRLQNDRTREASYLSFGSGFFGVEECENEEEKTGCSRVTPGETVNESLNNNLDIGNNRLELADEFNELFGALFSQLATKVLDAGGLTSFKAEKSYEGNPPTPEKAKELNDAAFAEGKEAITEGTELLSMISEAESYCQSEFGRPLSPSLIADRNRIQGSLLDHGVSKSSLQSSINSWKSAECQ